MREKKIDNKLYRIETFISEYNLNDEGFYNIKACMETARGVKQLKESVDINNQNIRDFINRRISNGPEAANSPRISKAIS